MSKSFRKNSIIGITSATSEKKDKRIANKRLRLKQKKALRNGKILPTIREVSNIYSFVKDGKQYCFKNSSFYKKILRK